MTRAQVRWRRGILGGLLALVALSPATAQTCGQCPGTPLRVGMCGTPDIVHTGAGCSFNYCQTPQVASSPTFDILPQPDGTFIARMVVQVTAPWNQTAQQSNPNGTLDLTWFDTPTAPTPWTSGGNPSLCEYLASDRVNTYVEKTGLTCDGAPYDFGTYSLRASMCGGPCPPPFFPNCGPFCGRWIDKGGYQFQVTKQMLHCPQPKEHDCDTCDACLWVGGGNGKGGGSKGGGPGEAAPGKSGPGALLRYAASGVGGPGFPGTALWQPILGRYWSHDYAERVVLDPVAGDDSRVWLLTRTATFRRFSKTGTGPGLYTAVGTGDEYRKLTRTAAGWQLAELDGTVHTYDAAGRWSAATDPNGNAKQATYDGSGRLTRVTFPDARREDFTYSPAGRLATITEVGVDGATSRTWSYTWIGDDLTRIDRPDGTAWEMFYQDAAHPGYMTRMDLVAAGGAGRRVESAWEYDASGNIVKLWRGDTTFAGPGAVDRWSLAFDNPVLPTQTILTDPLGKSATYAIGRDPGSNKPRVTSISGDCPTCGLSPNIQLFYDDPANPLRPTRWIDGRGTVTLLAYDANGQATSRTDASGTALARTTIWEHNGPFPALVSRVDSPSTSGSGNRSLVSAYDGAGNLAHRTISGTEAASSFSYTTDVVSNSAGRPAVVDPPGYGTQDQTLTSYDPARGNLVPLAQTSPLIGATTLGYDAFNRLASATDPNGEATETTYDLLDRVAAVRQRGATPAADLVTTQGYDGFGDLTRTTLPRGNVVDYSYDGAGRLVAVERRPNAATAGERIVFVLDGFGHRIREERQRWSGSAWMVDQATDFVYSSRCHLDRAIYSDGTASELAYDCEGNLEKVWDPAHPSAGQTAQPSTTYTYDALNRITAVAQPWGGSGGGSVTTAYAYDTQDHLTQITDPNGAVTRYSYSDRDLLTRAVSEVSGTTSYSYNEHGQLTGRTDARSVAVATTVDAFDRRTLDDFPDNAQDTTYTYDDPSAPFSKGRLTAVARGGQTLQYGYDRFGRLLQDGGVSYAYDPNGNRSEVLYPGGVRASFSFDFADRPAAASLQDGGASPQVIVAGATYKAAGPLASLSLGNGLTEQRGFDGRFFPSSLLVPGRLDWTYSTDAVGDVTAIGDQLSPGGSRSFAYQDDQYYLTQGNGPWGTRSWSYDRAGNRLTESRNGVVDSYTYAANGAAGNSTQLVQVAASGGGGTSGFFYDAAGDETFRSTPAQKLRFSYGSDGRLAAIRVEQPSGPQALSQLSYDGRGFLASALYTPFVQLAASAREVAPTYGSDGLLLLRSDLAHRAPASPRGAVDSRTDSYVVYFGDRPVALYEKLTPLPPGGGGTPTVQLRFLTTDHLGTPVLATDAAGAVAWSGGFEPFGADWSGALDAGIFLALPGQWLDRAWQSDALPAGLANNLNRWYEAGTGRYSQPDPLLNLLLQAPLDSRSAPRFGLALPGGRSWTRDASFSLPLLATSGTYEYADSRPLSLTDPYGLWTYIPPFWGPPSYGPFIPGCKPTPENCGPYKGTPLFWICMHAGDNFWSNCTRECLLRAHERHNLFVYLFIDHPLCFEKCNPAPIIIFN